jgi:hypothetical protein
MRGARERERRDKKSERDKTKRGGGRLFIDRVREREQEGKKSGSERGTESQF